MFLCQPSESVCVAGLTQIAEKKYAGKQGREALDSLVAVILKKGGGPIATGTVSSLIVHSYHVIIFEKGRAKCVAPLQTPKNDAIVGGFQKRLKVWHRELPH